MTPMINLEQQGLSIATYRPSGFRSGGRIVLDDAACFRLRLQPLTDSWQVKHQEKLSTLRINPYRRKTNGSKERILELEFAPDAIDRNWLLIGLTSCYTILFLQPALGAVGGGGG